MAAGGQKPVLFCVHGHLLNAGICHLTGECAVVPDQKTAAGPGCSLRSDTTFPHCCGEGIAVEDAPYRFCTAAVVAWRGTPQSRCALVQPCAGSDQIGIQRAVEKYEDIDLQFAGSREGNLFRVRAPCRSKGFDGGFKGRISRTSTSSSPTAARAFCSERPFDRHQTP